MGRVEEIGNRVREIRLAKKLTQDAFGEALGVTGGAISRIEAGDRPLTRQMGKAICHKWKADEEYLFLGVGAGPFKESEDETQDLIDVMMVGENETAKALMKAIAQLSESDLQVIEKFLDLIEKGRGH